MSNWQKFKILAVSITTLFFTTSAHPQELRKVRVAIPTLSPIIAATLVPRDKGYFKQEGYRELFSFFTDKEYADIPVATFTRENMCKPTPAWSKDSSAPR